jgi:hypothetical protein
MANNINELYDQHSNDPLFVHNFKSPAELETFLQDENNAKEFKQVYGPSLDETQLMGLKKKEDTSSSNSVSVGVEPMVETPPMGVQDNSEVLGAEAQGIDLSGQPLPELGYGKGVPLPDPAKQKYVDGEVLKIQKFLEGNNPGAAFSQLRQLKQQNPDLKLTPEQNATLTTPLNKYLETRKAQPGSANLIKTITKDASDLGLTLATVKPELTPEQKAVSAAVKQIPAEKLKPDTQAISENVVGDMKAVDSDFMNKIEASFYKLGADVLRIPEVAYGLTKSMMTPEQRATVMLALEPTMKTIEESNIPAEILEKKAEDMRSKMQKVEGTISERFAEGDYANGFTMVSNSIAESLPSTLMVIMSGGGTGGLALMGATTAVAKKKELDQMDISEQDKYINAVLTGTSEALFEAVGVGSLARVSKSIFAREGADAGKEILRKGILDNFDNLLKKYPVLLGPLAEGMSEVATTIAQNATDKYTGVDPERGFFDGATDALIVGSAMGAGFGGVVKIFQTVLPKEQRNKITENQQNIQRASELIQDPNITPEKKEALDNLAAKSSAENTKLEKEGIDKLNSIPEENRMEFSQLSEKASNIEDQIDTEQDPLVKKALESELTDTQTKIKEIENAVQKQTTSEVPVQPETISGQEVSQGQPQAEPQVAPQEGQEVTEEPKFSKAVEAPVEDVIKSKKNEDNDHTVTLNGEEVGMMYYNSSQKTWVNANFNKDSEKPYTAKWIYGDMLGDTKQEAIDELVRRFKENKPEVAQQENKVDYTQDKTLNNFLNVLNGKKPLVVNPLRPREFIYNNKAALEFNRFDKGNKNEIDLQDISVIEKGKGEGKAVMKDITDAADKSGTTLTLEAKPFGQGGLNKKDLINFYKKNGFEVDWQDAYGGDFNSEQELIDYALANESEGVPMKRMPMESKETKFSKTEEGEVDNSDIEAIREEMNNMPEEKANFDVPSDLSTKNKLDTKTIAPKLKAKLKGLFKGGIIKNLADWNGIPMTFTISDQLASEPVKNPLTDNTIDTNGGLLFSLTKGNENSAWANTDESEAKKMLSRAQEVYGKNQEIYQRLWKEGTLPYGHIPMAIIKMGQDSILSNEALFRIGSDNIKTHFTTEERTNALEGLKEDVSAVDPNASVLEFIDQNKFTTIDQLLDKMADLKPIGDRKIVSRFLFTGSVALDKETKPGTPQSRTALALVGGKDASFNKYIHLQTLNNIIQEKATAKIPSSHIIGIAGVDVLNPALTKPKHSNYPDGVKGQLIGLVESPVHAADIFPEMYSKTFYLQKENKAGKPTSPKAAAEQAVAPSGFVASIKAFRGAKISTKMTELQKLLGKLKLAFPSVTIVDSAQEFESALNNPEVKKFVKDGEVVYGFTKDGKVYLNPDKANANTAIHEFSHIWMNFLKQNNPALLKKGYDILEGTDLLKKKIKELGNTELAREEAMAEAIANKGETLIEAGKQSKFKNWLNAVFSYVKEKFKAFDQYTPEELQDINLNQFIEGSLNAILSGKEVTAEDIKNFEVAFSKAAKPLDITQITPEYNADIAAGKTATEAMKNLLAQGYSYNQIGNEIGRGNIQDAYNNAIAEMGKEVADRYSDAQEVRLKEIENYLGSNPVSVEQLRADLIELGYADLEIFTAMNRNLFSQQELFDAFGKTYRQTVQNAILESRYPAQDLNEISDDARNFKVLQSVSDLTDNFADFTFVDANILVEHMVKTIKQSGLTEAANALAQHLKGKNVDKIPLAITNFGEIASIAGRILVMARFAKKDMSDLVIGSIERGPIRISEESKAKIKKLVQEYNLKKDVYDEARQTFGTEKDDASFTQMLNAEADFYKAGDALMDVLEKFKLRYWNDVLTSFSTRALLSIATTPLSLWGNIEQGLLGQVSSPVRAAISKVKGASKKTNRLSFADYYLNQSLSIKKGLSETWDIISQGKYRTPDMAEKYMDGIADVNAQTDIKDSIRFIAEMIGSQAFGMMGSPYTYLESFDKTQKTLTDEEFAAAYDKLMYQTQNGDIKLTNGKAYTVSSAIFRSVIGTIPEITGRMLAISGDRIAFHAYKTRTLVDYIRMVEAEVKAGKRDTELQRYIAKELKGKVKKSDMDLLINLSTVLSDNSDFGREEALKRVFMNDNFATKIMGGARSGLKSKITEKYLAYLSAKTLPSKLSNVLAKNGYQGLDVITWTVSPFTRVPVNVLAAGMQNTMAPVSALMSLASYIKFKELEADFNKKYGANKIAELKSESAQREYEKARQELFEKRRQMTYDQSAVVTSVAVGAVILQMAISGALTPPAGADDEDRRKALNAAALRPSEFNITYYGEYMAADSAQREKLMVTRGWKPGDKVIGYQNFGLIGQAMGYYSSNVYQFGKEKVKKSSYIANQQPTINGVSAFFSLGESSIQNISALQTIGLALDISKAPDKQKAFEKLLGNMLAATGAVAAPNALSYFSKGKAQTQMSLGQVIPSEEVGGVASLGRVGIQAATKLSKNSQVFGAKTDYFGSGIGVFGEELKLNLTGEEPGTAAAYLSAMINPFGLRSFAQVKGGDVKAELANNLYNTVTSMSMVSDELGLVDDKGKPLNMWSALSVGKNNTYEIGSGVSKVTLSLPFDMYRKELQILGELRYNGLKIHINNYSNNLEQLRMSEDNLPNIEKLTRDTFSNITETMKNTLDTYESEFTSLRLRGILNEMDRRGLITQEDKNKIELALPGQFIK